MYALDRSATVTGVDKFSSRQFIGTVEKYTLKAYLLIKKLSRTFPTVYLFVAYLKTLSVSQIIRRRVAE
jgi:hypothetical protein